MAYNAFTETLGVEYTLGLLWFANGVWRYYEKYRVTGSEMTLVVPVRQTH
jgi:hypothetical protein